MRTIQTHIIIHGTKGSPEGNWFPWLSEKLSARGARVIVPRMPTPEGQSLEGWLSSFVDQVGIVDERTCIIGHSIGATFLLRYLEGRSSPIGCAVFVAGLTGAIGIHEYDELNQSFISGEYDWSAIKRNAGRIVCFAGDSDPYVPSEQQREMAERLGADLRVIDGGGHLNAESGYHSFDELFEVLVGL
jgi:predicted alpha/beta hydrolase family esterase